MWHLNSFEGVEKCQLFRKSSFVIIEVYDVAIISYVCVIYKVNLYLHNICIMFALGLAKEALFFSQIIC